MDRLLAAARAGKSSVLVVRGEPGIGKSALLQYALETGSGLRVTRAVGVESEMELAFAGLHQLCTPLLGGLERLPPPQRDALETAFGLSFGVPPERFLVGLAVLGLLSDGARERPLLCLVDDAQWLDQASVQALAFAARRMERDPVVLLFGRRESDGPDALAGLPELRLAGLGDADARELLASVVPGRLEERVAERLVAETKGNPLALLQLPRAMTPAELAGGFGPLDTPGLSGRIEESFRRRLEPLPEETRRMVLVAAAEPVGDPVLLWRACSLLGIGPDVPGPAEAADLMTVGTRVTFFHPLVRSAVYRAASPEERREVHRALAQATDPQVDPDRRAWHRAQAVPGPDEGVATELERSADRAQARGGLAAAAAFLERAAELTLDPARRAARAVAAAQAKHEAGAPDAALQLLANIEAGPLEELQRAQVDLLRAQVAFAVNRGNDAPPLLLKAARRLEPLDVTLARETYLELLNAALVAGPLASGGGLLQAGQAARAAPPPLGAPRAPDLLLDGLALLVTDGYVAGAPTLKRALSGFRSEDVSGEQGPRWLWPAIWAAMDLWDDQTWHVLSTRYVRLARDAGALTLLQTALAARMGLHVFAGEFATAASLVDEIDAVTEGIGSNLAPYGPVAIAVWQGREADASELIESGIKEVLRRGEGVGLAFIHCARSLLHNSYGRYEDALAAAELAYEYPAAVNFVNWALTEQIEAAARSGRAERGADALERLSEMTRASGTEWALGIEARSRALLSEDEAAEALYREAIDWLGRSRIRVELARAHLLYGEWLRRQRRRQDARVQLRSAHELCTAFGMKAFAERAARELAATGETARKRVVETSSQLTAQESQVARLASDGFTNAEIGARLFISPSTVDYHLRKVFRKLGVKSRTQLARHMPRLQ